MTPRAATIGELSVLLEGFPPPRHLSSLLVLTQHMKLTAQLQASSCMKRICGGFSVTAEGFIVDLVPGLTTSIGVRAL